MRDVGVFAHSNVAVAEVAELLNDAGIDYGPHRNTGGARRGPRLHGSSMCLRAGLMEDDDIRESLALFLTASVRGRNAPPMALELVGSGLLPIQVENMIGELEGALKDATSGTIGELGEIAMRSWYGIGFTPGFRPWQRAAQHFARLLTPFKDQHVSEEAIRRLLEVVERSQTEALIDIDYSQSSRVKLMTYHQTKSRRQTRRSMCIARGTSSVVKESRVEEASRLLNVAITRARKRVVLTFHMIHTHWWNHSTR